MVSLWGVLRWSLRPIDTALGAVSAVTGGLLGLPWLAASFASNGRRALTMRSVWRTYNSLPLGRQAFAGLVHFVAPYTGSVNPVMTLMTDTRAEGYIVEKPWLTNPFNSVHAVALTNLGEFISGVLVTSQIEEMNYNNSRLQVRGIVIQLGTTYHKKARGRITAVCDFPGLPTEPGEHRFKVTTELYDAARVNVATTEAQWIITIKDKNEAKAKKAA